MDDKQLEVIGLYSFLHVGKIQVSLAEALKIGQAREIKVRRSRKDRRHHLAGPLCI